MIDLGQARAAEIVTITAEDSEVAALPINVFLVSPSWMDQALLEIEAGRAAIAKLASAAGAGA